MRPEAKQAPVALTVLVAALGYFVDIYDLILFSIVRVKSLAAIGVPKEQILDQGVLLINMQMGGMLIGGILWGVLGDKRGRVSVLFGSIFMYSVANIANGFVQTVPQYAALRLIAGVGLAGELGAGITLVSEIMHRESRGYGTTIVATIGILGAVVAALIGDFFDWRTAYFVGGGMGLALLLLRVGLYESGMFAGVKASGVKLGSFSSLFSTFARAKKYLAVILVGVPIWFAVGVLVTFAPELGKAMGMSEAPAPGRAVMMTYIGLAAGDLASGALSQLLRSRKRVLGGFIGLTALAFVVYFTLAKTSLTTFYGVCLLLGFATGYWAVFVTMASELFGTNIRATVTTTAPNFVRGAVVLLTFGFKQLKDPLGVVGSAIAVGVVTLLIAVVSLLALEETFGKSLDYVEE
ncbi:MAG: MFS transporter [Polyangiaceae bacterium]|nr:MFS transporter [Polyangiaceae bacterium]MCL4756505.1 MFS transporter [Myxococcales bacterium]